MSRQCANRFRLKNLMAVIVPVLLMLLLPGRAGAGESVVVGYREDARPFVHMSDPEGPKFSGFLSDFCDAALSLAGYEVKRVAVDAASRWRKLDNDEVDMLCDTTSVTLERAGKRLFTPIIFLSGVSYAYSAKAEQAFLSAYSAAASGAEAAGEPVGGGPALGSAPFCAGQVATLQPSLPADRLPVLRVGVLNETTAQEAVRNSETLKLFRLRKGEKICIKSLTGNYEKGVADLCRGDIAFFFGDRDMLQSYLEAHLQQDKACDAILSGKFYSYEPYALVVRPDRVDLAVALQAAIYETFASGKADSLFNDHFRDRPKSSLLEALFRINRIGRVE
jgi:ABC-type amino acid transport substrate-binding protein